MIEPKIRLSLRVQGAQMLSSQVREKDTKGNYTLHKLTVEYKEGKKRKKEVLGIPIRKSRLVTQSICICKEAYDYMLSTSTSPKFLKKVPPKKKEKKLKTIWETLSTDERLRHHFDLIAKDFRAVSYTYEILED